MPMNIKQILALLAGGLAVVGIITTSLILVAVGVLVLAVAQFV